MGGLGVLQAALRDHASQRFSQAVGKYREVLSNDPYNAEALLLLGIALRPLGFARTAVEALTVAAMLREDVPHFHVNLGDAYRDLGDPDAAVECYRKALRLRGNLAQAHLNLGDILAAREQWCEAHLCYGEAITSHPEAAAPYERDGDLFQREDRLPESVDRYGMALLRNPHAVGLLLKIGGVSLRLGKLEEAVGYFRAAVAQDPQLADGHFQLGDSLYQRGDREAAIGCYREAIRLMPFHARACSALGSALGDKENLRGAVMCCRLALSIRPSHAGSRPDWAGLMLTVDDLAECEHWYLGALSAEPESAELHNAYGNLLVRQQRLEESATAYRAALKLDPVFLDAHINLGTALLRQAMPAEALVCYGGALRQDTKSSAAHYYAAMAFLLCGDYEAGWREWEWRTEFLGLKSRGREFSQPLWKGEPLDGKAILLHAEQGLGDTLQFARYVQLVAARGGKVILQTQRGLRGLLQGLDGVAELVVRGEPVPGFAYHCPLMSLPLAFGTEVDTIPPPARYGLPNPVRRQGKLRVGLAWAGNPRNTYDPRCSLPLKTLAPLRTITGASFVSLQTGPAATQIEPLASSFKVQNACAAHRDMAETCALIEGLDLVISVDTAIAHLAGSMGKPVWVMLPHAPDWRWLLDRDDSPWYPAARLFRQPAAGDWRSVVEKIARELKLAVLRLAES
jgi:tetratricopeptide (TPR) repeat protein